MNNYSDINDRLRELITELPEASDKYAEAEYEHSIRKSRLYLSPDCSIQKSSLATEDCIWLGCDHETVDPKGTLCGARMHLTQSMAADLIPLLQHFVDTGELPQSE